KNINNEAVNSTAIRMWFIPLYDDYCHTVGFECKNPSGCGYDDTCPISSVCESGSVHECQPWTNWACWSCSGTPQERRKRYCDGCSDVEEFRVPSDTSRCCDVKYKVAVRVSCTDDDDGGSHFETYGSISISIGSRTANQNIKVF
uniref:Uncharacterized protein n=1 Tax=Clytia hemisphaerica TaxID=252671 RepID=A0A7M5XMU4_9CNID